MIEWNRISIARGAFFAGTSLAGAYILCAILDLLFPDLAMRIGWSSLLPPIDPHAPSTFVTRLVEIFLAGVIFALAVLPIYNLYFFLRAKLEEYQAARYNDRWKYF